MTPASRYYHKNKRDPEFKLRAKLAERRTRLKKDFGITPEQYEELLIKQNGCCAVCGKPHTQFKRRLAVDHDHVTMEIRGLLCGHCNFRLVGRIRDPELFRKAAEHVESHTGWFVPKKVPKKRRRKRK